MQNQIKFAALEKYETMLFARHIVKSRASELLNKVSSGVPLFIAANSLLETDHASITRVPFTSTISYPATEYDTINTATVNFQDVLLQKGLACDPLWSDEGVYRIAQKLQFLQSVKYGNIFLGIGGLVLAKVIIIKVIIIILVLEERGVKNILVGNEIYGPNTSNSVMIGSHYWWPLFSNDW